MTLASEQVANHIKREGIIVIIRGDYALSDLFRIGEALLAGLLQVIEVTLNTRGALEVISALRQRFGEQMLIGAGTVRTRPQMQTALAAGAQFTVAPNFDPTTAASAQELNVLHLPGVFTPTEAQTAFAAGCRMVKLFPSEIVGPAHLKTLRAPLDDIEFVPTGGIGLNNIADYAQAGAAAVGVGGALIPKTGWTSAEITARAKALKAIWNEVRSQ